MRALDQARIARIAAIATREFLDTSGFVRVWADDGTYGTGELIDAVGGVAIINDTIGPALVGRNPLEIEGIWSDLWSWSDLPGSPPPQFVRGLGGPFLAAVGGLEMALWDLAGKLVDLPVYQLLGGRVRKRIPVYLHVRTAAEAPRALATGVRTVKCRQGHPERLSDMHDLRNWTAGPAVVDRVVAGVQEIRDAVGTDVGLAVDCLGLFDAPGAKRVARALEPLRLAWIEEITTSDNPKVMADIRRSTSVPLAAGENIATRHGFQPFFEQQALSIAQPDPLKGGGLLETRKIAAAAEVYRIPIAPHGVPSPLGFRALMHVAATIPNLLVLEWAHAFDARLNALAKPPVIDDGFVILDERPGLGVELDDHALAAIADPWPIA